MKNTEEKLNNITIQKEKIRQRYKGIDTNNLDVIPALPQTNFYDTQKEQRVAVYARVSTDDPKQTSSYELQKNHYQDVIAQHPGWKLVEIYADEGISGTSLKHRNAFIKMIADCKEKKIDLIITKSVSRFARNVVDCIGYIRQLSAMQPPVGIYFEAEGIFTLNSNSEMMLSFISTLAQEESHNKSEIMNTSIEMRFRRGIFLTPPLLGYDQDENGNLIINEEEAKTVRLIFFLYLYGYTCQNIADKLTELKRKTKKKNTAWSPSSVLQILQNERHCGDILARKTWTPNYLDHKSIKNRQNRNQYRQKNHHEPIINRDDFIAVQHLISNAKYGNKEILPKLKVISSGVLKGYVSVNPRWAGFKANDYCLASSSIYKNMLSLPPKPLKVRANPGDFDLRGYEITRGQFFDTANKVSITFSSNKINFSAECVRKFSSNYVELLVHPINKIIAIRQVNKDSKNAVQWSKHKNNLTYPRIVRGTAFLPNLYELFDWNINCKYRILGVKKQTGQDALLLFNISDAEMLIPNSIFEKNSKNKEKTTPPTYYNVKKTFGTKNSVLAYPEDWIHHFGNNFYCHAQSKELAIFSETGKWETQEEGTSFVPETALHVTSIEEIEKTIETMINDMKQEVYNEQRNQNE